jgi:hypothetical protein
MKERLRKLLSVLCAAAMLCGCLALSAAADGAGSSTITVVWNDENQASLRTSLEATLTVGDSQHTVTLNADNSWTATLSGLKAAGTWAVEAPAGYTKSVSEKDSLTVVTLTYREEEKVSVQVSQRWEDQENAKGVRPQSVSVRLLADGAPYQAAVPLNSGNGWTATFKDLPKYRKGTEEAVNYTVQPAAKTAYYDTAVTGSQEAGYALVSTLQTGTLKVKVSFSGAPADADFSALQLAISGADSQVPATISYADLIGGTYEKANVLAGNYVVQEKNPGALVEGYMLDAGASVTVKSALVPADGEGAVELKNVYQPLKPEAELTGDGTDADLSQLQFRIEGPDPTMPMTLNYGQFTDGKYEIEGLEPGTYVVYELNAGTLVDSFELTSASITGVAITVTEQGSTAKLFNQYQPMTPAPTPTPTPTPDAETVEVPVTKTWEDNDDKDGNRPGTVTVRLYANGEPADVVALNAANDWQFTFTDLAKYDEDGNEIVYTISEDAVPWYDTQVDGYHLTNVYHPETTSVSVRKVWNDNNNKSRIRPSKIRVYLSNGMSVILNADNNWQATIDNLPTKLNGQTAVYTWSEQEVLGYYMSGYVVNGSETVITNSLYRRPGGPGEPYLIIEEYGTPLGIEVIINHVGDCFD